MNIEWKKFISVEILILALTSAGAAYGAWSDVKSDIAVIQTESAQHERNYERIDGKLDQIMSHLLREKQEQ